MLQTTQRDNPIFPSLYHPNDVHRIYDPRIHEFVQEALERRSTDPRVSIRPMVTNGLVIIDPQRDFMSPDGSLFVKGSPEDLRRIIEFIYHNLREITSIYVSLDSHKPMQIFFPHWWGEVYGHGSPKPFSQLSIKYPESRASDDAGILYYPVRDKDWSHVYLEELSEPHTIWPLHCIVGTPGHQIMPALVEALTYWSIATKRDVRYIFKGLSPYVEHFGIYGAEVVYPKDPNTFLNIPLLEEMKEMCAFQYISGVTKCRCVRTSEKQAVHYYPRSYRGRLIHLDDASSSLSDEDDEIAERHLAEMCSLGMTRRKTTDSIFA